MADAQTDQERKRTLKPGEKLGGYLIEARIASGGMGTVYRAHKEILDKTVALKVLHPEFAPRKDYLARFMREARVASDLDHPGIVKVLDAGEDGGLYYIAMEFVEGIDLRTFVSENGPLSPRTALRMARQVAEALDYAHGRGLVHRDVKPANLLMARNGRIKLADFGLARLVKEDHEVTVSGQVVGTPAFMSPEQCRDRAVDGRSDLYSLGASLYYLLSGKLPFSGKRQAQVLHDIVHGSPPPLRSVASDVPDKVASLVHKLLSKHPSARFQNGRDLIAAIDEILAGNFVTIWDPSTQLISTGGETYGFAWGKLALGLVAASVIALGFLLFSSGPSQAAPPDGKGSRVETYRWSRYSRSGGRHAEVPPRSPGPSYGLSLQQEFKELEGRTSRLIRVLQKPRGDDLLLFVDRTAPDEIVDRLRKAAGGIALLRSASITYQTNQKTRGRGTVDVYVDDETGNGSFAFRLYWIRRPEAWYIEEMVNLPYR